MRPYIFPFLCVCLTVPVFAQNGEHQRDEFAANAEHFEKLSAIFRQNIESAAPTVVDIQIMQNQPAGRRPTARTTTKESGSGIIATVAKKQVILTNRHVIDETEQRNIAVLTYDRKLLTPVNIVTNEEFDLAVIEVAEELPQSARFGNSDQVHVGDIVLAVGNPFGLDRSVSMGVISAVGRRRVPGATGSVPCTGFFQTDAAVNPGSSGGMLLNLRGETIGILTAIATQGGGHEGVAFAMPINTVLRIAEQLVQTGMAVKPHIGCGFEAAISSEERRKLGIVRFVGTKIGRIDPDTPAEKAGLKVGDVVMKCKDIEVEDALHVIQLVAQSEIDKPMVLQINRNGEILNITVTPTKQLCR